MYNNDSGKATEHKILPFRKGKNSIREIAKLTGVSVSTVQRVKASLP